MLLLMGTDMEEIDYTQLENRYNTLLEFVLKLARNRYHGSTATDIAIVADYYLVKIGEWEPNK